MLLKAVFDQFVQDSPISVMFRGVMERALAIDELDQLFTDAAERQYTRKLLFSSVVDLMSLVVCQIRGSVHAAYQATKERLAVSVQAVYDKLDHLEPGISAALAQHSAAKLLPVLQQLNGGVAPLLPGYRLRILDGNHLAATEHRLQELRSLAAGPLPGQTLVILDPEFRLVTELIPEEDGHAQERALLSQVLALIQAKDVWVADRNFCTTDFLFGIQERQGYFIIRQHAQTLSWKKVGRQRSCGRCATGRLYEQTVELRAGPGAVLRARRITLKLDKPTRDGDWEIHILTNLPARVASAKKVAEIYRERWSIEIAFGELTTTLSCEVKTLGYPKAALFGFAVAVVAYNILSTVKGALRAAHGVDKIEQELSAYYVADEVAGTYRGMLIAIPEQHWQTFAQMSVREMATVLKRLARNVRLEAFQKHPRGPKKPPTKKQYNKHQPHVSTARILARRAILTK
jgi:IS4 transposase